MGVLHGCTNAIPPARDILYSIRACAGAGEAESDEVVKVSERKVTRWVRIGWSGPATYISAGRKGTRRVGAWSYIVAILTFLFFSQTTRMSNVFEWSEREEIFRIKITWRGHGWCVDH